MKPSSQAGRPLSGLGMIFGLPFFFRSLFLFSAPSEDIFLEPRGSWAEQLSPSESSLFESPLIQS